jgi:hypothetical protein
MDERKDCGDGAFWLKKIRKHWIVFLLFVIGCIIAFAGALMVLFWHIDTSQAGAMGMATIGDWTLAWIWEFFIFLIIWELILIGIPIAIAFGLGYNFWWKNLPEEERAEFEGRWRGRGTAEGGGFSFGMFIAYSLYMYINGEFYTPFGNYAYSFWVNAWFHMLAWLLIIFGIPAAIILTIVYFTVWRKKETEPEIS